jgi:hypothetical protein
VLEAPPSGRAGVSLWLQMVTGRSVMAPDKETCEALKALGYVGTCPASGARVAARPSVTMVTDRRLGRFLRKAIELFNEGRFSDFQDAVESFTSTTRASERAFYRAQEPGRGAHPARRRDLGETEQMVTAALRKLDQFLPRYRGINVVALRDDFRTLLLAVRESARAGAPSTFRRGCPA